MSDQYKVEYLSTALNDILDIVKYIRYELADPEAAIKFTERIIEKEKQLSLFPYSSPAYIPIKHLKYEYRKLIAGNYLLFYWVNGKNKTVTVARVIHNKMNYLWSLE